MENFGPRSNPPQPKALTITPPPYSVPDVSRMFDSDTDSLIWKPEEIFKKSNRLQKDKYYFDESPSQSNKEVEPPGKTTYPKNFMSDINKNNIISEDYVAEKLHDSKSHGKIKPRSPFTSVPPRLQTASLPHKKYNPELYSPTQNIVSQTRLLPKVLQTKQEVNSDDKMATINYLKNNAGVNNLDYLEHGTKPSNRVLKIKPNECNQNVEYLDFKLNRNTDSPKCVGENSCEYQISNLLKLIEDQNQQILQLQKLIGKLIEVHLNDKVDKLCLQCKKRGETTTHVMSTQTVNDSPITKEVSTNTDLPWTGSTQPNKKVDLVRVCSTKKLHLLTNCNKPCLEYSNGYNKRASNHDIPSREEQVKNVHLDFMHDPPMTGPSPCINDQECHDDRFAHPTHNDDYDDYSDEEDVEYTNYEEGPLPGESAMMYNKRREQGALMRHHNLEGTDGPNKEKNGFTFYNKVMINVNQFLQPQDNEEQDDDDGGGGNESMMLHNQKKTITHMAHVETKKTIYHQKDRSTRQQLQQYFGISFLEDNMPHQNNRRGMPMAEMFHPSGRPMNGGYHPHDLEILNDERRRMVDPYRIADSFGASAQNSPGRRRREHHPDRGTRSQATDFSVETEAFLGKYRIRN